MSDISIFQVAGPAFTDPDAGLRSAVFWEALTHGEVFDWNDLEVKVPPYMVGPNGSITFTDGEPVPLSKEEILHAVHQLANLGVYELVEVTQGDLFDANPTTTVYQHKVTKLGIAYVGIGYSDASPEDIQQLPTWLIEKLDEEYDDE